MKAIQLLLTALGLLTALVVMGSIFVEDAAAGDCPRPGYAPKYATPAYSPLHNVGHSFPFIPKDLFLFTPPIVVQAVTPPVKPVPADQIDGSGLPRARGYADGRQPAQATDPDRVRVGALLQSCAACHTQGQARGGVSLFSADGQFDPKVSAEAIYLAVKDDAMPPRGPKLDAEAKEILRQWAESTKGN